MATEPVSVSKAVAAAKHCVSTLGSLVVIGEVTGFRGPNARSGHCYFQIKDDSAAMDAIVWRGVYAASGVRLRDGMQVLLTGSFDVYAGTGRLSFVAKRLTVAGEGLLRQQVAELARRLEREGLMDPARKRPIPRFCERVAVVTSLSGSVIDDVKRTLSRRNPLVMLQVAGCMVQGPGAPASIIRALGVAAGEGPDAILLVRGGGSFEDLMTFNDEALARAVAACPVPVITGIGHEPDTSICDMVADRRCSTPTAAAESVAPAIDEIAEQMASRRQRLVASLWSQLEHYGITTGSLGDRMLRATKVSLDRRSMALEALARHRCLVSPTAMFEERSAALELTGERLDTALPRMLAQHGATVSALSSSLRTGAARALEPYRMRVERLDVDLRHGLCGLLAPYDAEISKVASMLDALSPLHVLARGYAIVRDDAGAVVSDAFRLTIGSDVHLQLAHGHATATVRETGHDTSDEMEQAFDIGVRRAP